MFIPSLPYIGDAASVQGTDDLTDAASWATVATAVLDPVNQTATLPARKHYLRLSTEPPPPGDSLLGKGTGVRHKK